MTAAKRNAEFKKMVEETVNFDFGSRIFALSAFAKGAGCKMMFDETGFELRSTSTWCGKLLFKVAA